MTTRGPFAAVISDLGRPGDRAAGLTLLKELHQTGHTQLPYFIYTSPAGIAVAPVARALGSRAVTADPDELVRAVIDAVR